MRRLRALPALAVLAGMLAFPVPARAEWRSQAGGCRWRARWGSDGYDFARRVRLSPDGATAYVAGRGQGETIGPLIASAIRHRRRLGALDHPVRAGGASRRLGVGRGPLARRSARLRLRRVAACPRR